MPAKRHLKDKEARQLTRDFLERYPRLVGVLKSAREFEELPVDKNSILFLDGKPLILRTGTGLLPSLKFEELVNTLPKLVVDMGAVAHVVNGAHIMRPGIREFRGTFMKGDLVAIVDEKFGKTIALGVTEMDSEAMKSSTKGKVVANVHYVGDDYWKLFTAQ